MSATCEVQLELMSLANGQYRLRLDTFIRQAPLYAAVVLDMSNSCGGIREAARQLQILLKKLPRDCKLSVYRLSSSTRLNNESIGTAACLQDGRINFLKWLDDRRLVGSARSSGSFLSPVLQAVDAEVDRCNASKALVLLLTDAQLHDLGSMEPSDRVTIIGILPTADMPGRFENWKRVCPDSPLLSVSDPSLDAMIDAELGAGTRFECKVTPCSGIIETKLNSLESHRASEMSSEGVVLVPYGRSELSVIYDAPPAEATAITMSSADGKCLGQWNLSQALKHNNGDLISACTAVDGTFVFDSASGDYALSVEPLVAALRQCAESRTRWDTHAVLRDFTSALSGVKTGDYLICFCGLPSRLVIAHICSDVSPAIRWPTGSTTAFGISTEQFEIRYNRLERRWYLHGQSELEIDPRACQHLGNATFDSGVWAVYSSGPLSL